MLDPKVMAHQEAWWSYHTLMESIRAQLEVAVEYCEREGKPPKTFIQQVSRYRQMITEMEKHRTSIILTPLPGTNHGSKLSRGTDSAAATFTHDDLVSAVPDLDHVEMLVWAKDLMDRIDPFYDESMRTAYWNESKVLINMIFALKTTPRGTEDTSDALKAARADGGEDVDTAIVDWMSDEF